MSPCGPGSGIVVVVVARVVVVVGAGADEHAAAMTAMITKASIRFT